MGDRTNELCFVGQSAWKLQFRMEVFHLFKNKFKKISCDTNNLEPNYRIVALSYMNELAIGIQVLLQLVFWNVI